MVGLAFGESLMLIIVKKGVERPPCDIMTPLVVGLMFDFYKDRFSRRLAPVDVFIVSVP